MRFLIGVWLASAGAAVSASPFAVDAWLEPGTNPTPGYGDASAAVGSPERFTGEGVFPSGVTPFNPAFGADELVSVGAGGRLTLRFDTMITDDASHAFGVDLIVFGNALFVDQSWFDADPSNDGTGMLGDEPTVFGGGQAEVWVSQDGDHWSLAAVTALNLFPTLGYQDFFETTPENPGSVPTDFTRPMDPGLTLGDLAGMDYADLLALYGSSGGGVGIDISGTGLSSVGFVQIRNTGAGAFEIDAVSVVPSPGGWAAMAALGGAALRRRRR